MLQMLTANPFVLVSIGAIFFVAVGGVYFATSDRRLRPFLFIGAILTVLPLLTDYLVTTDREAIEQTVRRLARSVQANDMKRALTFAHPDAPEVSAKIRNEMPNYDFDICNVTGFRSVEIDDSTKDAIVKFAVLVKVDAVRGPEGLGPWAMTLKMRQDTDGKWKLLDYKHYPPNQREALTNF